ncbi:MgtC/SapB family protein [soil metagenome]
MPEALTLDTWELALRVLAAAALGGLIGFEREFADQPAGFRTHILVSLGATLFTIVGAYGVAPFVGADQAVRFDPTRVAAQVVTGIGFLGAGAILQQGVNVRGLTTAAALWVTAAVGTAVGLGYYDGAAITAVTTVAALFGLKHVGHKVFRRLRRGHHHYSIEIGPELTLSDLAKVFESASARTDSLKLLTDDDGHRHVIVSLQLPPSERPERLAEKISEVEGVRTVDLED